MSHSGRRERCIRRSADIYRMLLILYPAPFRREFGQQMVQVFDTACRRPEQHRSHGLFRFWLDAFTDLVVSASAERLFDMRRQDGVSRPYFYLVALFLSLLTGYLHLRSDADALSVALLLVGAFVLGLARPKGTWRFALILGLGIPTALLVGHSGVPPMSHRDADLPWLAPFLPTFIGAYTGAFIRHLVLRFDVAGKLDRQQSM